MKHYQIASPVSAVTSSLSSGLSLAMSSSPRSKDLNGLSNYEKIRLRQQQQKLQEEENRQPNNFSQSSRSSSFSSQHTIHANPLTLPSGGAAYHHSMGHNYYNNQSSSLPSSRSLRSVKSSSSIPCRPRKLSSSSSHHHLVHSPQSFQQQQLQTHRSRQSSIDNNGPSSSARHSSFDTISVHSSSSKIQNNNNNSVNSPFTSPDSSNFFSANSSPLQNNLSPLYKSPHSHQGNHQLQLDTQFAASSSGVSPLSSSPVTFSATATSASASTSPVLINPFNNFEQHQSSLSSIKETSSLLPVSSNTNKNLSKSTSQSPNVLKKSTSRILIKSHRSGSTSTHVSSSSHTYNDHHSTSGKAASVKSSHTTVFNMEDTLTADKEILEMMRKNNIHNSEHSSKQSTLHSQYAAGNTSTPNGSSLHPLPKSAADMVRLHQLSPISVAVPSPASVAPTQKKKSVRRRFFGLFGEGSGSSKGNGSSNSSNGTNSSLTGGGKSNHKGKDKKIDKNKIEVINQKIGVY